MKIITIFNFPNKDNYNKLCQWWLSQAIDNSDLNIEIWYEKDLNHLSFLKNINLPRLELIKKQKYDISQSLPRTLVTPKSIHNIGFKLYNLCQETEPFIFIDADAIILKNIDPLIQASKDKPFIAINHQSIVGHTAHIPYKFLNSGVQICGDPSFLNFDKILESQKQYRNFLVPGTDQSLLWTYCKTHKYDYTHPSINWQWNNCAGFITNNESIKINHYWYNYKPWLINCDLWNIFLKIK